MSTLIGAGKVGRLPQEEELPGLEEHTAQSKWQFCNCQTCQEKRLTLDSIPGPKIDLLKEET